MNFTDDEVSILLEECFHLICLFILSKTLQICTAATKVGAILRYGYISTILGLGVPNF